MTFRAQATADLSTFTNVDEFGSSVEIDGVTVACVVEGNGDTPATQDGVIEQDTLIHVPLVDKNGVPTFERVPKVGQELTIDDEKHVVVGVSEDQGMLDLRVRRYDS